MAKRKNVVIWLLAGQALFVFLLALLYLRSSPSSSSSLQRFPASSSSSPSSSSLGSSQQPPDSTLALSSPPSLSYVAVQKHRRLSQWRQHYFSNDSYPPPPLSPSSSLLSPHDFLLPIERANREFMQRPTPAHVRAEFIRSGARVAVLTSCGRVGELRDFNKAGDTTLQGLSKALGKLLPKAQLQLGPDEDHTLCIGRRKFWWKANNEEWREVEGGSKVAEFAIVETHSTMRKVARMFTEETPFVHTFLHFDTACHLPRRLKKEVDVGVLCPRAWFDAEQLSTLFRIGEEYYDEEHQETGDGGHGSREETEDGSGVESEAFEEVNDSVDEGLEEEQATLTGVVNAEYQQEAYDDIHAFKRGNDAYDEYQEQEEWRRKVFFLPWGADAEVFSFYPSSSESLLPPSSSPPSANSSSFHALLPPIDPSLYSLHNNLHLRYTTKHPTPLIVIEAVVNQQRHMDRFYRQAYVHFLWSLQPLRKALNLTIVVLGGSDLLEGLEHMADVHFTDKLPFEEYVQLLKRSWMWASAIVSGYELSIIESQMCGNFILSIDAAVWRAHYLMGVTGWEVTAEDMERAEQVVRWIVERYDPEVPRRFALEYFGWEKVAMKMLELFHPLLEELPSRNSLAPQDPNK
ncbi:hypothetical protein QOT17_019038 [Balamuthia mandrillaris]